MNWKGHVFMGVISTLTLGLIIKLLGIKINYLNNPTDFAIAWFAIITGSLLPDIDTQASKIVALTTIGGLLLTIYFMITKQTNYAILIILILSLTWILRITKILTHRGLTHKNLTAIIINLPWLYIGPLSYIGATTSYISHIYSDKISTIIKRKK